MARTHAEVTDLTMVREQQAEIKSLTAQLQEAQIEINRLNTLQNITEERRSQAEVTLDQSNGLQNKLTQELILSLRAFRLLALKNADLIEEYDKEGVDD